MSLADTHSPNAATADHKTSLTRPQWWRHEWIHSKELQERFISADDYASEMARQERARVDAEAASQSEGDRAIEAILTTNEREGRLRGNQASELAEIRARQSVTARASTPPIQPAAPRVATTTPPMTEAQRLAAIDALALPGHETLVAKLKADASVTPDQAAIRIATAEKARRTPPKPTAAILPFRRFASTAAMSTEMAAWRSEWSGNAALQQEFADADVYAHYRWAVATGRTKIAGRGPNDAA